MSDAFDTIVGKACLERGWVTRDQLVDCLRECGSDHPDSFTTPSTKSRLSGILVARGYVKPDQMAALEDEITQLLRTDPVYEVVRKGDTSLGQMLVKDGHCSKEQVVEALSIQAFAASKGDAPPRLGEILLEKGYVRFASLEKVLGLQKTKIPLQCTLCHASYAVLDWTPQKKYLCKKCTGPLLPPAQATADIPPEVLQAKTNPKNLLGKYVVVKELGRGGMGAVYKAWDGPLKRWVALKLLVGTGALDEVARFRREAQTSAALRHPNIVGLFEVAEEGDKHLIVMEFIDGKSLAGQKLPARKAAEILAEVARAVDFAHSRGIIHRDIKPHNIMLDREEKPFVMDFGLAKSIEGPSHLTVQGTVVGTPSYMSPEQASGRTSQVDRVSDVWSLGACLYEMLTGKPPFKGANPVETLKQVVDLDPVPPSQHNATVPKDLETIALKCLEKEKAKRYPSAKALADDLERFAKGEGVVAKRASVAAKVGKEVRRRWVPIAAGVAALVAVALVAVLLGSGSAHDRKLRSLLSEAKGLLADGKTAAAVAKFDAVLALDPENAAARAGVAAAIKENERLEAEARKKRDVEDKKTAEATRLRDEARARASRDLSQGRDRAARARTALLVAGADLARADADLDEAVASFGRAVAAAPELGEAYHARGQAHHQRQDLAAAIKDFDAALAAALPAPAAHYDRGRVFLEQAAEAMSQLRLRGPVAEEEARELRDKAKADLAAYREKAGADDPEQLEFAEALLAYSENRPVKTVEICDRLLAGRTLNADVDRLKGDALVAMAEAERPGGVRLAHYAKAAEAYGAALAKRPNFPEAHLRRAGVLFRLGKTEEALKDLDRSVAADRPNAAWYAQRGSIRFEMGRTTEAMADFERARTLRPDDPGILSNLGMLHVQQKDFRQARDLFERALKANPGLVDALAGRGAAKAGLGDSAGALEDLNAALPTSPRKSQLHFQIGLVHLDRKEWEKAVDALGRHLELSPKSEPGLFHRAEAKLNLDRVREAIADWEKCLQLESPRADEVKRLIEDARRRL